MLNLSEEILTGYQIVTDLLYAIGKATDLIKELRQNYDPVVGEMLRTGGYDFAFTEESYMQDIGKVNKQIQIEMLIVSVFMPDFKAYYAYQRELYPRPKK